MCTTCGCSDGNAGIEAHEQQRDDGHSHAPAQRTFVPVARSPLHVHADGTMHAHGSDHDEKGAAALGAMHFGNGPAHAHAPGMSQARMVKIEQDILAKNNGYARDNRQCFADHGIFALNLVSSPGSGKTTLLAQTIALLKNEVAIAVIEGDQQTSNDAERIRAAGARAVQINTGKGCHLDAYMVGHALRHLLPADHSLLMIENVGNLVCPAAFDLGEAHKVVVLSVTEGEDKPLKYPDMFQACDLMLLNKCDLLPYLQFDVDACIENALRINSAIQVMRISATGGDGLGLWLDWLRAGMRETRARHFNTVAALQQRVAELEARLAAGT